MAVAISLVAVVYSLPPLSRHLPALSMLGYHKCPFAQNPRGFPETARSKMGRQVLMAMTTVSQTSHIPEPRDRVVYGFLD